MSNLHSIWSAAERGDTESVLKLLDYGADIEEVVQGVTPLFAAAFGGHVETVTALLARCADPNAYGNNSEGFNRVVKEGNVAIVKLFLEHGANANATDGTYQVSILMGAADAGNNDIVHLLVEHGADINSVDYEGRTPVTWAKRQHPDIAEYLVSKGAREDWGADSWVERHPKNSSCNSQWIPGPGVTDHTGIPLTAGWNFFVSPPPEIGTINTAFTEVIAGKLPNPVRRRRIVTSTLTIIAVILAFITAASSENKGIGDYLGFAILLSIVFAVPLALAPYLILYLMRKNVRCEYVGSNGIAAYTLVDMHRGKQGQVLLFRDADSLVVTETPVLLRGVINAATSYSYTWLDARKNELFSIKGEYYSDHKAPADKFHFASASNSAWLKYREQCAATAETSGIPEFDLLDNGSRALPIN